jgi:eukaryotic-like serine/threonine-protein kinase
MTLPASAEVVEALLALPLLDAAQRAELSGALAAHFDDSKELLTELVRRGWLTAFQMAPLLQGRPQDLRVGPYVLLQRLGQGGMGNVYKARHELLNRVVALKVVRKDVEDYAGNERRFRREIQVTAQLSHPNIVVAHDAGCADGAYYFAMEYVEGIDLSRLVKQSGPLPITQACDAIRRAALGLQHAFEHGLVHRDIKPSNLLLTKDAARIKILDMGLVRLQEDTNEAALTESGAVIGTPDYVAPEQATNSRTVDIRADLYSLGCTFYFLLTGRHPFAEGTAIEKLLKHLQEQPRPVSEYRPEVPAPVAAILARLLAKSPDDRYQRPVELAEVLEPFCDPSAEPPSPPTGMPALVSRPTAEATQDVAADPPPASVTEMPGGTHGAHQAAIPLLPAPAPSPAPQPRTPVEIPAAATPADVPPAAATADVPPAAAAPEVPAPPVAAAPAPAAQPEPAPRPVARKRLRAVVAMVLAMACAGAALWRPWDADRKGGRLPAVTNSIGMELLQIPAGEFIMGSPSGEAGRRDEEGPPHKVIISRSYYLGAREATVAQFRTFAEATKYRTEADTKGTGALRWNAPEGTWQPDPKCTWLNPGWPLADNQPVVCISRYDALAFCYWLSRKEGRLYRLPTEAEWEYACRAGTSTPYAGGPTLSRQDANFSDTRPVGGKSIAGMPAPVGSFAPNAWGLFDMHGNAWEWCADSFKATYYGNSPERDPAGPGSGPEGVLRGGSWQSDACSCRSARRRAAPSAFCRNDTGFRVVREAGVR